MPTISPVPPILSPDDPVTLVVDHGGAQLAGAGPWSMADHLPFTDYCCIDTTHGRAKNYVSRRYPGAPTRIPLHDLEYGPSGHVVRRYGCSAKLSNPKHLLALTLPHPSYSHRLTGPVISAIVGYTVTGLAVPQAYKNMSDLMTTVNGIVSLAHPEAAALDGGSLGGKSSYTIKPAFKRTGVAIVIRIGPFYLDDVKNAGKVDDLFDIEDDGIIEAWNWRQLLLALDLISI